MRWYFYILTKNYFASTKKNFAVKAESCQRSRNHLFYFGSDNLHKRSFMFPLTCFFVVGWFIQWFSRNWKLPIIFSSLDTLAFGKDFPFIFIFHFVVSKKPKFNITQWEKKLLKTIGKFFFVQCILVYCGLLDIFVVW